MCTKSTVTAARNCLTGQLTVLITGKRWVP